MAVVGVVVVLVVAVVDSVVVDDVTCSEVVDCDVAVVVGKFVEIVVEPVNQSIQNILFSR